MWAKIKRWFYKLIGRKSKEDEVFGLEVFDEKGDKTLSITSETAILKLVTTRVAQGSRTTTFDFTGEGGAVMLLGTRYLSGSSAFEITLNGMLLTVKLLYVGSVEITVGITQ